MQHRIIKPSRLLNKHGELIQRGYATSPILTYLRKDVTNKFRLKEWDYYLAYNQKFAVALTIAKNGSIILISTSIIDFISKEQETRTAVKIASKNKLNMPESSETGDIVYQDKEIDIAFRHMDNHRNLTLYWKNFDGDTDLIAVLTLSEEPMDSMVIATPFKEDKKDFYYNRKIIGMRASGKVFYKDDTGYSFNGNDSFALLDWGRGVWPYHTTWYWSAAQGITNGNLFGFNLGYGFGDTRAATENMLFFNGFASNLEDVVFHISKNSKGEYEYMKPWHFTSSDHRLELEFIPILDRFATQSVVLVSTCQHQVFGRFSGSAVLDDGSLILLNDFLGFVERVENRW